MVHKVDTLIVGAGVIGSSVAMHCARQGVRDIRVIDFDLEGSLSSSELNAGGVRATWNQPINILLSQMTIDFFARVQGEVGYRACGYLWLHTQERLQQALQSREKQLALGWPVEVWTLSELGRRVPFLDKTHGIEGAIFSPRDGLVNPNLVKNYYRSEARKLGVLFEDRTLLRNVEYNRSGLDRILVEVDRFEPALSHEVKQNVLTHSLGFLRGSIPGVKISGVSYDVRRIINCAGPWASEVARILGYSSPSFPMRRQICLFDSRDLDLSPYGMIVEPSGVYFHPEGTHGLAGYADPTDSPGFNYQSDGETFFLEKIWPPLFGISNSFERLKYVTGWAGLYDVSPDESAILGQVRTGKPEAHGNVFEAHSFSGHGVMQSYGAGAVLAEQIVLGKNRSGEWERLSGSRFERGERLTESWVI